MPLVLLTRILKINLGQALKAEIAKTGSKVQLANRIGVSPQTLNSMIEDDWPYITRDSIERAADHLNLPADQVFEFVPVNFWNPIRESPLCYFLRGSHGSDEFGTDITIPGLDNDATDLIKEFLRRDGPKIVYADRKRETEELLDLARSQNCIVIGGSKSNTATEILLSRFFNAEPFNSEDKNRQKIPFGFCYREDNPIVRESSLTCSSSAQKRTKDQPGIAVRGGIHVPSDYRADENFASADIKKGRDAGLVFVANRPFESVNNVKLIVVAGFTGIGTVGACKALIEDFRYLEPTDKDKDNCVYGVVQVNYFKKPNTTEKIFQKYNWIYRKGGHLPISPNQKTTAKPRSIS